MSTTAQQAAWEAIQFGGDKFWTIVDQEATDQVIAATDGNQSPEDNERNARLIAAAPELLEALQQIAGQCGPYATKQPALDYATIGNIARQAIAKATNPQAT